jgi:hypothetical protein
MQRDLGRLEEYRKRLRNIAEAEAFAPDEDECDKHNRADNHHRPKRRVRKAGPFSETGHESASPQNLADERPRPLVLGGVEYLVGLSFFNDFS